MIITVDNVEIVLSQSSDKTVTIFVEMRDGVNWKNDFAENEINQLFRDLADWYYAQLEKEYDHLNSDDCIAELLGSNEFDYLESGKQYY